MPWGDLTASECSLLGPENEGHVLTDNLRGELDSLEGSGHSVLSQGRKRLARASGQRKSRCHPEQGPQTHAWGVVGSLYS